MRAAEIVYNTREGVAKLLNVDNPENVVFTYNATYALNLAIKTLITEKCHVITSDVEHNSVIRPLRTLEESLGIEVSQFDSDVLPQIAIPKLIRPDTKFIVSTLASNVTGCEIDVFALAEVAKCYSLGLIVDASQVLGHRYIDFSACECDAICAPGHKALFGIQGTGFAYFKDPKRKGTLIEGGSGTNSVSKMMPDLLPEAYEAGTLGTPGIAALMSGIEFIMDIGLDNINHHLNKLREEIYGGLSGIPGIELYESFGGNVLFNFRDLSSTELSYILDKNGVCTRGGLHCAPSVHKKLGTLNRGAVRLTFSIMNTKYEAEHFIDIIKKIVQK